MQFTNSIALEEVIDEGQASYTHVAAKPSYLALAVPSQTLQTEDLRRSWIIISDTLSPIYASGMCFPNEHVFTREYLSRFPVQSDDMWGIPAKDPTVSWQPAFCAQKQEYRDNPLLFKVHNLICLGPKATRIDTSPKGFRVVVVGEPLLATSHFVNLRTWSLSYTA